MHRRLVLAALLALAPVCALAAEMLLELLGEDGTRLRHAVVYVAVDQPDTPEGQAGAEMDHRDMQFAPHVLGVRRGTLVDFPNRDQVRHHVYSFSPAKRFELPLYHGRSADPVLFDVAGVVVLGCNIHDHMVGYLLVLDTPYIANAADDGVYRLALPADYRGSVRIWHPALERQGGSVIREISHSERIQSLTLPVVDEPPPDPAGLHQHRRRGIEERFQRHRQDER